MRYKFLVLFLLVFIQGCSFKAPENKWEYNSANAFSSYTKNFLSGKELLVKDDLYKAITHAKQSANLEQLGRVYLGYCALNISVGVKDKCIKFKNIQTHIASKELNAYYLMLQKQIKKEQIEFLPKQYQEFISYKLENHKNIFETIKSIKQISSQFVAASLIKDRLDKTQINYLIEKASFYGYKKLVLFWLENLIEIEDDKKEKQKLMNKISILKS